MPEEVKFSEDEMKKLNDLQESYVNSQNALGQLSVNRIRLEQQLKDLDSAEDTVKARFVETQTKEREFGESINGKYGDGNLDLTTGIFKPNPKEETEEKNDKNS